MVFDPDITGGKMKCSNISTFFYVVAIPLIFHSIANQSTFNTTKLLYILLIVKKYRLFCAT